MKELTLDQRAKNAFWNVVEECLIEFHQLPRVTAHKKSKDLRARIESLPREMSSNIREDIDDIYHDEPFYVACDVARRQLDLKEYYSRYAQILDKYDW
jgi:hypothetical protein